MKLAKLIPFLFLIIFFETSYSQVKFSAGPTVGLTAPMGDYGGTTIDYYYGSKYGLGSGINLGAIFKAKFSSVSARVSAIYSSHSNTGNSEPGKGYVETKQSLFIIGLGPEFAFSIQGSPIKPYVGVDLLITNFSGETTFRGVARVPSDGTYSMSSATRTGIGFGAGIDYGLGKKYSLEFGIRYNLHNVFSKSFVGGDKRIFSYTSLNDDKDPLYPDDELKEHFIGSTRSITTFQFNLAFLFDF